MLSALIFLLFTQQPGPDAWAVMRGYDWVHYDIKKVVPTSGKLELKFDDLHEAPRTRGGCSWMDETKPGSYMPFLEADDKHQVVKAPVGHTIAIHCDWIVPKVKK
jgi:hypothetical protein